MNREIADLAVAWTTQPSDYENHNTKLLSLLNREDPYLSVAWTTRPPDRTNYINTTLQTLNIAGPIHSAEKKKKKESVTFTQIGHNACENRP